MQVNHTADHITHAVIGKNKVRDLKFADNGHLAHILSSALYSDKPKAVAREPLCNAWDSHIENGKTDIPIQITIKDEEVSIRDFGAGIHDDKIVDVYGTYGGTTKVNDGRQTGGFGLGSKAPFAMVDHFQVDSYHQGRKTIYTISKSSAEVDGRPGITPIVSVPTDETGLCVSFKLKSRGDAIHLRNKMVQIIKYGEMNATINGVLVDVIPFSKSVHGYTIFDTVPDATGSRINVRYGNVVYPVVTDSEIYSEYNNAISLLDRLGGRSRYATQDTSVILEAKPHSISVTPSRESLSMTEHTIATVKELLINFVKIIDQIEKKSFEFLDENIQEAWNDNSQSKLLDIESKFKFLKKNDFDYVNDVDAAARMYVRIYPDFNNFQDTDIDRRITSLIQGGFGNKGKLQSFRKAIKFAQYGSTDWVQKYITGPLVAKLHYHPILDKNRLFIFGEFGGRTSPFFGSLSFMEAKRIRYRQIGQAMPLLRNFVILTYNRMDLSERAPHHPAIKHWYGKVHESLVYITPRIVEKVKEARAFFRSQGYYVIDLTTPYRGETVEDIKPTPKPVPTFKRPKGMVRLDHILDMSKKTGYNEEAFKDENAPRLLKPEVVVHYNGKIDGHDFNHFTDRQLLLQLIYIYGSRIGIARTNDQKKKAIAAGSKDFHYFLLEELKKEFENNPGMREVYSFRSVLKDHHHHKYEGSFSLVANDAELAVKFGVKNPITGNEAVLLSLWDRIVARPYHFEAKPRMELEKIVKAIPQHKKGKELIEIIKQSKDLDLVNVFELRTRLQSSSATAEEKARARKLFLSALKDGK